MILSTHPTPLLLYLCPISIPLNAFCYCPRLFFHTSPSFFRFLYQTLVEMIKQRNRFSPFPSSITFRTVPIPPLFNALPSSFHPPSIARIYQSILAFSFVISLVLYPKFNQFPLYVSTFIHQKVLQILALSDHA